MGYSEQGKGIRFLDADTKKVVILRGATFDDSAEWLTPFDSQNSIPHNTEVYEDEAAINPDHKQQSGEEPEKIETAEQSVQYRLLSQKLEFAGRAIKCSSLHSSSFPLLQPSCAM